MGNPTFIADFPNSVAFLNFDQETYPGQSLLIVKGHVEHLHLLPDAVQQSLHGTLLEMAGAYMTLPGVKRINYECLGNAEPHVHWHIVPRRSGDLNDGGQPLLPLVDPDRWSNTAYRTKANELRAVLDLLPL